MTSRLDLRPLFRRRLDDPIHVAAVVIEEDLCFKAPFRLAVLTGDGIGWSEATVVDGIIPRAVDGGVTRVFTLVTAPVGGEDNTEVLAVVLSSLIGCNG